MQVILKNAEELLFKDVKNAWECQPHLRCLYFKKATNQTSDFPENSQSEWVPPLLGELRSYIDDASSRVYICHDSDVFILARSITNKRLQEFLHHLEAKLGPASFMGLAYLFEVGVDWPRLRTLCERKIEAFRRFCEKRVRSQEQPQEFKLLCVEQALNTVDETLITTLAERRAQRKHPVVMVVEDDALSQKLISIALKDKYALAVTPDGQGAILNYVRHAPDILFLDIGLPDMDGHKVLERLFAIDPEAHVVMFSGNGSKENILKSRELGAKGFIGKPFTQDKLFWTIERSPFILAKLSKEAHHGHLVS
ncbi:MAG: response regulator [Alphaproteobacteria bacterium]|nr:response regulator [Alphaproteobacteria bacterium]MBP7757703.1 response regulator [Alphaproteobacteria bacterium]MBP7761097.1 response regulator [Alphaproteobacteria bacterium]MBP7904707.1 response regulator [Alphaproteobacteria bacterium]